MKRLLWLVTIWAVVAIAWMCGACTSFPIARNVHGTLTRVERDPRYEMPCTLTIQMRDKTLCDLPPVCCSYHVTAVDSMGRRTTFWAFWPRFAAGLKEGDEATFHLHRGPIYRFPCSLYGCQYEIDYAVLSDTDITK